MADSARQMVGRGAQITLSLVRVSGSDCNLNLSVGFGKRRRSRSIEEAHPGLFSDRLNSRGRRIQEKSAGQSLRSIFKSGHRNEHYQGEGGKWRETKSVFLEVLISSVQIARILTYHIEERDLGR